MNVLVTGGAGYIGSHAALRLLADGHAVTILDDLSRGNRGAVEALMPLGDVCLVEADVGDRARVEHALGDRTIDVVMHFAAKAYVGESVEIPLQYYRANTAGALSLLEAMNARGVDRMVFSSTCAVYGEPAPERIPIGEACPRQPVNPYGRSKLAVEQMLGDHLRASDVPIDKGKTRGLFLADTYALTASEPKCLNKLLPSARSPLNHGLYLSRR